MGITPSAAVSSETFHAFYNGFRFLLFQLGTASTEGVVRNTGCSGSVMVHSLVKRLVAKHMDMFPCIANGNTGLPESVIGHALCVLCICDLLSGSKERSFWFP